MKLADVRKLAIRKQAPIRFRMRNGMDCVISQHGVAHAPELRGVPDFNFEEELAQAGQFTLEESAAARSVSREELAQMLAAGPVTAPDAHEDE